MRILETMISIRATLTPMVILLATISLSSCKINKEVDFDQGVLGGRSPAFSVETKERAIAACIKMKQKEHNWKQKDMIEYCSKQWRGYITFIEENKDVSTI